MIFRQGFGFEPQERSDCAALFFFKGDNISNGSCWIDMDDYVRCTQVEETCLFDSSFNLFKDRAAVFETLSLVLIFDIINFCPDSFERIFERDLIAECDDSEAVDIRIGAKKVTW